MRFKLHSPETFGGIKIDWDAPVELGPELREAMAPHDVDSMRVGILTRGFAVANVTYPRGTIVLRVAEGHELFLQLPFDTTPPAVTTAKVLPEWTVETTGGVERHRGLVGTEDDGERIDLIIAARVPTISRAKVQQLIEDGHVSVAGQPVKKSNRRLRTGDRIDLAVPLPPAPT